MRSQTFIFAKVVSAVFILAAMGLMVAFGLMRPERWAWAIVMARPNTQVTGIAASRPNDLIVASWSDGQIIAVSMSEQKSIWSKHSDLLNPVILGSSEKSGEICIVGDSADGEKRSVEWWAIHDGALRSRVSLPANCLSSSFASESGDLYILLDNKIIYKATTKGHLIELCIPLDGTPENVAASPDGTVLIVKCDNAISISIPREDKMFRIGADQNVVGIFIDNRSFYLNISGQESSLLRAYSIDDYRQVRFEIYGNVSASGITRDVCLVCKSFDRNKPIYEFLLPKSRGPAGLVNVADGMECSIVSSETGHQIATIPFEEWITSVRVLDDGKAACLGTAKGQVVFAYAK